MKMWQKNYYVAEKNLQGINPLGLCAPWDDYKNKQCFKNMEKKLRYDTIKLQWIKPTGLGAPWWPLGWHLPTKIQTWRNLVTALKTISVLTMTGEIKKLAPSPKPSTNLLGKKIRMSGLDKAHWKFDNTPEGKFKYQWTLIQLTRTNR